MPQSDATQNLFTASRYLEAKLKISERLLRIDNTVDEVLQFIPQGFPRGYLQGGGIALFVKYPKFVFGQDIIIDG